MLKTRSPAGSQPAILHFNLDMKGAGVDYFSSIDE